MARLDALGTLTGFGVGGTTGGLASAAVPVAGFLAKRAADAATTGGAASLGDLIRASGSRAALATPPNALQRFGMSAGAPITDHRSPITDHRSIARRALRADARPAAGL